MEDITGILVDLFVLFAAAKAAGELFTRMRQPPAVVGVLGVVFPFALGFGLIWLTDPTGAADLEIEAAFVATAMVATSVGITARVLRDLGAIDTRESRIILGAAVVDDI